MRGVWGSGSGSGNVNTINAQRRCTASMRGVGAWRQCTASVRSVSVPHGHLEPEYGVGACQLAASSVCYISAWVHKMAWVHVSWRRRRGAMPVYGTSMQRRYSWKHGRCAMPARGTRRLCGYMMFGAGACFFVHGANGSMCGAGLCRRCMVPMHLCAVPLRAVGWWC